MSRRVLVSSDAATPALRQHTGPCGDCPWRRDSLPGWLGGADVATWTAAAHGEERIDCHTLTGAQCAGAAVYRANVCKVPREASILQLPANAGKVFSTPAEFRRHHKDGAE